MPIKVQCTHKLDATNLNSLPLLRKIMVISSTVFVGDLNLHISEDLQVQQGQFWLHEQGKVS